ncbi:tetrapyrrole methylase [Ceratobasidium sp. AG-I]|nr:tetrapyrrole methylase [Ceratobasidium sp. AG-I]
MTTPSDTNKKGTLTIAGSGIASIRHITLETLSYIKESDKIYYLVADPATEAFIIENANGSCVSLYGLYGIDKIRYDTYVQMSEVLLRDVRAGFDVLGIFYGHPGVFVSPTQRAMSIALEEGFQARMLPGVSAEDYLFADLRVDPCMFGCAAYEATELLYRKRRLNPTMQNIIWQVGKRFTIIKLTSPDTQNSKFGLLVDHLEEDYGPDHKVVHYIGAVLPQATTVIQPYTISELRKPEVASQIRACSTFYIPPRDEILPDASMSERLGLDAPISHLLGGRYPRPAWSVSGFKTAPAYGPREKHLVAELNVRGIPEPDMVLFASQPMRKFMADLALKPRLRDSYRSNPQVIVDAVKGLTSLENMALKLNRVTAITRVMSVNPTALILGIEPTETDLAIDPYMDNGDPKIVVSG